MLLLQETDASLITVAARPSRQRLIMTAALLFQKRGYHGVGTAEILRLTALPRGSLYHHFPGGKSELACACAHWVTDEIVNLIERLYRDGQSVELIPSKLLSGMADWLVKNSFSQGSLLTSLTSSIGEAETEISRKVSRSYERITESWTRILIAEGIPKISSKRIACDIVSSIEGSLVIARSLQDVAPIISVSRRLRETLKGQLELLQNAAPNVR